MSHSQNESIYKNHKKPSKFNRRFPSWNFDFFCLQNFCSLFRRFQFFSILKSKNYGFKIWALGCSTAATNRLGRLVIISHDLFGGQSSLSDFMVKPKSGQHFRIDFFRIADQKKLWYRKLKWRNQSSLRVSISSNGLVQTSLTRGKTNQARLDI